MSNDLKQSSQNKCVILTAPSGAGKSTLANLILSRNKNRFTLSISDTTRNPRGQEKEGIHYFFKTVAEFKKKLDENAYLEHAYVFSKYYYGTPKAFVENQIKTNNVLFDIDVQGAQQIKKIYKDKAITIFIHAPSFEELETRLRNRKTESEESIQRRLKTAREEIALSKQFDYNVTNFDVEKTYQELIEIFKKAGCL